MPDRLVASLIGVKKTSDRVTILRIDRHLYSKLEIHALDQYRYKCSCL